MRTAAWIRGAECRISRCEPEELPPAVSVNGSLYLIRTKALREERTFFPKRTVGVPCTEPWEPVDIDTEADWVVAEALATHYGRRP